MKIERARTALMGGLAALMIAGVGAGAAFAAGSDAPPYVMSGGTSTTVAAEAAETVDAVEAPESTGAPESAETEAGPDADGPGGHEDPVGQDVDHRFEGQE